MTFSFSAFQAAGEQSLSGFFYGVAENDGRENDGQTCMA